MKRLFLILVPLGLLALFALTVGLGLFSRPPSFSRRLAEVVPASLPGWTVRDLPLAATEGMLEHVNKVLLFDDSVQRIYRKGALEIVVYAAYWSPGKVTTADAGTHNPDSCWVNNGMTRRNRRFAQTASFGGMELLPFEYGEYSAGAATHHVVFWHLVQGEPQRYEEQREGWRNGLAGRIERLPLVLHDLRRYGLNQRREQLFIRISANIPLDFMKIDPDFATLMKSVSGLGVFRATSWAPEPAEGKPAK